MSWLVNTVQPNTARGYLLLDTTCKIWSAAVQTYSQIDNNVQIYEPRKKVYETKQREMRVSLYQAKVSSLWQELDYYQDFQARCPADATKIRRWLIRSICSIWLESMQSLTKFKYKVLGRNLFPALKQTYSYVSRKKLKNAMFHLATQNRSTMVVNSS